MAHYWTVLTNFVNPYVKIITTAFPKQEVKKVNEYMIRNGISESIFLGHITHEKSVSDISRKKLFARKVALRRTRKISGLRVCRRYRVSFLFSGNCPCFSAKCNSY